MGKPPHTSPHGRPNGGGGGFAKREDSSDFQRRKSNGLSLSKFANARGGTFVSHKKEAARIRKLKTVASYKKLLKREGIASGSSGPQINEDQQNQDEVPDKSDPVPVSRVDERVVERDPSEEKPVRQETKQLIERPTPQRGISLLSKERRRYEEEMRRRKQEAEDKEAARIERAMALREQQRKRHDVARKLGQRTKRGQPILSHQIEHLLEKIQKSTQR